MSQTRPRRWLPVVVVIAAALGLAGTVTLGLLWHSEVLHVSRVETKLDAASTQLASTKARLSQALAQLSSVTSLADKRRAVLLQAQRVLTKVEPLLSSVDNLQGKANNLQSQGSTLSSDAENFIQTSNTLENYLAGRTFNDPYISQLVDQANSELATVHGDESAFGGGASDYSSASTGFGTGATAFSAAVRSLQRQLKGVTGR